MLTSERILARRLKELKQAADAVHVCGANNVDFEAAFEFLREHNGVKRVLCEGGGRLNDSLLRAGVVDEVNLTICPLILGGQDAPTIADGIGFGQLDDAAVQAAHPQTGGRRNLPDLPTCETHNAPSSTCCTAFEGPPRNRPAISLTRSISSVT